MPPDSGDAPVLPTSHSARHRAATRVRWWLGRRPTDALLGVDGPDPAARALLANHPTVTVDSGLDGADLLADRLRDHPEELPSERWGARLSWVRNLCMGIFVVGILGVLVAGLVLTGGSETEDPFDAVAERLSPTADTLVVVGIGVPFAVAVLLIWPTQTWRHVITLAEARYAVRWASRRPGQLARGLPVADPFVGLGGVLTGLAVIVWILAGFAVFLGAVLVADGDSWPVPWVVGLALVGVGWLLMRGRRALRAVAAVAGEHLLLMGHRDEDLRLDAATTVRERFVLLTRSLLPVGGERWSGRWERTVYPLTADLPPEEIARRHDQADQDMLRGLSLVGDRSTAPLVTLFTPSPGHGHHVSTVVDTSRYAGGWVVARMPQDGREQVIIVADRPERFLDEVLPLFGDRHGLDLDALEPITPVRLPDAPDWAEDWTLGEPDRTF